jgi:plasmid stabilization system protein ParE
MLPVRLRAAALLELTEAWPRVHGAVRRHIVRRFPYSVLYLLEPEHIEVLAVFHFSRDPRRWQQRTP